MEAVGVSKRYGEVIALDGVSLEVMEGEVFGLLGPNGAGKTTLMEILVGLRRPDSGKVRVAGRDPTREPVGDVVAFVPQETMLYGDLTVEENLEFIASLYSMDEERFEVAVREIAEALSISDIMGRRFGKLSGGLKRRVSLAASLLTDPIVVIMDEPTVGLDPDARRDFWEVILDMKGRGRTVILSTHYMEEADELCDRVAVMDAGRVVEVGDPDDLKRRFGGRSKVVVRVRMRDEARALEVLSGWGGRLTPDGIVMEAEDPERMVPEVISTLNSAGIGSEAVQIRSPTLEDVFMNLTGKSLREAVA